MTAEQQALAIALFVSTAEGNTVVVADLLAEQGVTVHPRTVQRIVRPHREAKRAAEVATVRFETAPGHQLQIDFGENWVWLGEQRTRVMLFVAVLGYSRREYVQAFLSQRHDDWREGLANAFRTSAASRRPCSSTMPRHSSSSATPSARSRASIPRSTRSAAIGA